MPRHGRVYGGGEPPQTCSKCGETGQQICVATTDGLFCTDKCYPLYKAGKALPFDSTTSFELKEGPFKGMTVIPAPVAASEELDEEIQTVLDVIGCPHAYVTDWSSLSDFRDKVGDDRRYGNGQKTLEQISEELNVSIAHSDLIVDIATRISQKRMN